MRTIITLFISLLIGISALAQTKEVASDKSEKRALKQAYKLRKRLLKGANFHQLAEKYSDDPGSAQYGGNLGSVQFGQFVPEFDSTVLTLQPGEISEPVRTDFGYHLIELIEKDNTTFSSRHILIKP